MPILQAFALECGVKFSIRLSTLSHMEKNHKAVAYRVLIGPIIFYSEGNKGGLLWEYNFSPTICPKNQVQNWIVVVLKINVKKMIILSEWAAFTSNFFIQDKMDEIKSETLK